MEHTAYIGLDSEPISYLCKKDKHLAKVISMVGPLVYTQHGIDKSFSFLVHEIIEQMLSIKAGQKIYSRLETLCGGNVTPDTIASMSFEQLSSIGTSASKARCILSIAELVNNGEIEFASFESMTNQEIVKKLTSVRGIGNWTAKMYLLFILERPDILPFEDGAFLQTYRWMYRTNNIKADAVIKKCKKWSPYTSIAARYMYRALDMGLTKQEFHLFKED